MRDGRAEALQKEIAERLRDDLLFRKAYAELRETCAFAVDPRTVDRDLARLIERYRSFPTHPSPISARFEAVLGSRSNEGRPELEVSAAPADLALRSFLNNGILTLLRDVLRLSVGEVRVLDPWAGAGELALGIQAHATYGNTPDPLRYGQMAARLGRGAVFAESFHLPERKPTPGFAFFEDENTARVDEEQTLQFEVVLSDLRGGSRPDARAQRRLKETWGGGVAAVRWMADRVAIRGVVAFLSDQEFVDEPAFAGMRAGLEREFGLVAHLALATGVGATFLVKGGGGKRILYAKADDAPKSFDDVAWQSLEPTPTHVWRTEILRDEWASFPAIVGERGAIFRESGSGIADGLDTPVPAGKARKILRQPFVPAWRTLDRKSRRVPAPIEGPTIVTLGEPFGVVAANVPIDRRFGGADVSLLVQGGRISAETLRRFRAAYGAAITERDVYDASLALLHHPEYRVRYREDLRRGVPRLPLPSLEALARLHVFAGAPPVGPGTAFRTGWLDPHRFEAGTVPDYDDPFASPYARADVEPSFLLLVGLGAALYHVEVDFERLIPASLDRQGEPGPFERMRLSTDRSRLIAGPQSIVGIPSEAFKFQVGRRSVPEWVVEGDRPRSGFDPGFDDDPEKGLRLFGQAVTAGLEIRRLIEILEAVRL